MAFNWDDYEIDTTAVAPKQTSEFNWDDYEVDTTTQPKKQVDTTVENPSYKPNTQSTTNVTKPVTPVTPAQITNPNESKQSWMEKKNEEVKARAKENLRKRAEWEQKHPFISGIQKDYQLPTIFTGGQSYRGQVPQWELEAKYGLNAPWKEQKNAMVKSAALNLVAPTNITVDAATGGTGKVAKAGLKETVKQTAKQLGKAGGIGGAVQGFTSSLADNGISPDLLIRPLQYGTLGLIGGSTMGAVTPVIAKGASNVAKAAGKAKDKVADLISSTEAGSKALQAVENAKNKIGEELVKPRTFKQARAQKLAQKQAELVQPNPQTEVVNENMLEGSTTPVKVKWDTNTPETNLPPVNEAPTSSNIPENMAERGSIKNLREIGVDTSDLPEDVRLYEKKTYQDTKNQLDSLTPEERAKLVNDGNTSSDVSNLAMIEDIKTSLENGEVPYELLNKYTKAGTEQARTLQSRSYLTNTPEGSLAALHKAMQDVVPGVKKLQEQSKELTEAFLKGDKRAVNNIINKAGLKFNKNKTDFIDDLTYLKENNLLNENEVARLVEDKFGIGKVTKEDYDNFVKMYDKLYQLPSGSRAYEVQKAEISKYIADKLPVSIGQKLRTLRNIGWLLNFKTTTRNILGNTAFNIAEKTLVDPLAAVIDKGVSLFTGERSRVMPQYKELLKGFWDGIRYGIDDVNRGINTKGGVNLSGRYDLHPNTFRRHSWKDIKNVWKNSKNLGDAITQEASMVVDNVLHPFEKLLGYELQAADRAFYQMTYEESILNQMKALGLKKPTDEIRKIANEEALESVFQNNSALSNGLAKIKKGINDFAHIGDFGVGDLAIPYVQTPANIGQQAINYSPLGAVRGIYKYLQSGNQRNFTKDLSRAIVGTTGAYGVDKAIEKAGYEIVGKPDNYGKEYKNDIAMGKQYEAIKTPDGKYYSYTNIDPITSVIRGAVNLREAKNLFKEEEGLNKAKAVLPLLRGAIQPTADMLGDTTDILDALKEANQKGDVGKLIDNTASRVVDLASSGFARNIGNATDSVQRETKGKTKTETSVNKVISGTPWRSKLPVKNDSAGQPIPTQGVIQEVFNPIKITTATDDPVLNQSYDLYKQTGKKEFLLPEAERSFDITNANGDKEKLKLNNEQYSRYQQLLGTMSKDYRRFVYENFQDDGTRKKLISQMDKYMKKFIKNVEFGDTSGIELPKKNGKEIKQILESSYQWAKEQAIQ